jgi:anti-sigma-K factor RskA
VDVSTHRDEHLDLCAAYVLGCIAEADRQGLEAHLAEGCARCEAALAQLSGGAVLLASAAPPAQPDPALKDRVMRAVRGAHAGRESARGRVLELKPRRPVTWVAWGWAAAAAALAVADFLMWGTARRLSGELESARERIAQVEQRLEDERTWAAVLSAPGARVTLLAPTGQGAAELRARATYDPATQRAVVVCDNLRAPSGSDYELWAILGSGPASLGVIRADESGRAVLRLENVGDPAALKAFAVSLERAGGSPNPNAPAGPVVMAGNL